MLGIPKEKVHELPEVHYPGRVILIDSAARAKDAVAYLLKQRQIGFDTETRPSFRKDHRYKVSLVQLSVPGECFLFRLKQIGSLDGLMSIFENPDIQKIGLSLKDDFHSLGRLTEFTPAGFVELQTFVKRYEIADNSLQKIFALIFGKRISKNQRLTNWEAPELTLSQQQYAAIDAWACVEIYNHLLAGKFDPSESPYSIDDETATMLQSSVGIHTPILHSSQVMPDGELLTLEPHTYGPSHIKNPSGEESLKEEPQTTPSSTEKAASSKPAKSSKSAKNKPAAKKPAAKKPVAKKATTKTSTPKKTKAKTTEKAPKPKPAKSAKPTKAAKPAKTAKSSKATNETKAGKSPKRAKTSATNSEA